MPLLIISCILITITVKILTCVTIKIVGTYHVEPNKHSQNENADNSHSALGILYKIRKFMD